MPRSACGRQVGGDEYNDSKNPIGRTFLSGSRIFAGATCRSQGKSRLFSMYCLCVESEISRISFELLDNHSVLPDQILKLSPVHSHVEGRFGNISSISL